jgi:hypothetical protein
MPSLRVVHVNGEDLGVHRFSVPDWKPGDTIPMGGLRLQVVGVEWSDDEDDEIAGTLTVEISGL